jgi:AcrR family transcriptional regulator
VQQLVLFDRYGYEAVTVAQIAAAAGVSRKTFFNYFPGKEDVVFSNPQRRLEAALRVIAGRAAEPPAAAGQLTAALHAAYRPQVDEDSAAVLVGAVLGAVLAASNASLRRGDPPAKLAASVRRAARIVTVAL